MLKLSSYSNEIDDIEPGQTIRINHTECDAGEDTRQRLYLTRTHADPTVVVGYCHNCQQGGRWNDTQWSSYRELKHQAFISYAPEVKDTITEPPGLMQQLSDWPVDAQAWAVSRRLDQVLLDKYSIAYDPTSDRVYLPKLEGTELVGYQLRAIHEWQQPKYYTVSDPDAKSWTFIGDEECTDITIVEDLVSGIHIAEASKTGVVVLHGVKIDPVLMYLIARNWKSAVIWLDNDSQHVDNQAKQMERTIKMYSPHIEVGRVSDYQDPKYYKNREIVSIIEEALDGQH